MRDSYFFIPSTGMNTARISALSNASNVLMPGKTTTSMTSPEKVHHQTFAWRSGDKNDRVETADYDGHSGPISFYADTVAYVGSVVPAKLRAFDLIEVRVGRVCSSGSPSL
jgi:hypothetical protein